MRYLTLAEVLNLHDRVLDATGGSAGENSGSKIGINTCAMACCSTLSVTVGMPSNRSPPFGFGMVTLRTGFGR